ncbi:MAG: transcriptional regulator [Paenibacillus sp. RIFOXYA1_FULL_44_5]|nr:MAG: transcriptional regulator [Paenibacillus sp. RIFOXYA1_FULL_44_5]
MEKSSLPHRIRAFRKLKGHTQSEMAHLMGISVAVLGSIERGTRYPDEHMLHKISEVLEVGEDELLGMKSSPRRT